MEHLTKIAVFIFDSFIHIWPYLVISIPLAVLVRFTNVSKIVSKVMNRNPLVSIVLATILGAFSPFCSCGVIPVITSLLIGGVPLAPVMAFWIASPSMDPEVFFLSAASIGWKLSVWRLTATLFISLFSGFLTHLAVKNEFVGNEVLKAGKASFSANFWKKILPDYLRGLYHKLKVLVAPVKRSVQVEVIQVERENLLNGPVCCVQVDMANFDTELETEGQGEICGDCHSGKTESGSFLKRLLTETWSASALVIKFMALAFLINALIKFYIPEDIISGLLGGTGSFSVIIASLVGIPVYTSNITALPVISGLLSLGMNEGAALAFLIVGPTTTLPALMAVWGIAKRRVFLMYLLFSLFGGILFGFLYLIMA